MKKALSLRQKVLLLIMGCIFLAGVVYGICQITIVDAVGKLKKENADLTSQYEAVESYVINREFYESETVVNTEATLALLNSYVNGVTDKSLLYDFDRRLESYAMQSSALSLNDNVFIEEVQLGEDIYTLQTNLVSVSFDMTLENLKKFIADIREGDLNLAIQNIAMSPNLESGTISGTLTLNQNSVVNTTSVVTDPTFTGETGVNELFD